MVASPVCPYCRCPLEESEVQVACEACGTQHHAACWEENQGCTLYGCEATAPVEPRTDEEIPEGWWGKECKQCPVCKTEIRLEAIRCRTCGSVFEKAPQNAEGYAERKRLERAAGKTKTMAISLALACLITCTAPLAIPLTWFWRKANRENLAALPSFFDVLCKIGLVVAVVQTVLVAAIGFAYHVIR